MLEQIPTILGQIQSAALTIVPVTFGITAFTTLPILLARAIVNGMTERTRERREAVRQQGERALAEANEEIAKVAPHKARAELVSQIANVFQGISTALRTRSFHTVLAHRAATYLTTGRVPDLPRELPEGAVPIAYALDQKITAARREKKKFPAPKSDNPRRGPQERKRNPRKM